MKNDDAPLPAADSTAAPDPALIAELEKTILNFSTDEKIESFYIGHRHIENFELPDSILVFMHDRFYDRTLLHRRYMLVFSPVATEYELEDGIRLRVMPGEVLFIRPFMTHRLLRTRRDPEHGYPRLIITFELKTPQNYLPDEQPLKVSPTAMRHLSDGLTAYREKRYNDLSIHLYLLLAELSRNEAPLPQRHYSVEVRHALSYIHSHLGRSISLAELARCAHTSVSTLRQHFTAEMGVPPGLFITRHRLEIAKTHLLRSNIRVDELAQLCGFRSIHSFSHFFKKHTGLSPLAWKKANRTDHR